MELNKKYMPLFCFLTALLLLPLVGGCDLPYFSQAMAGHFRIMNSRVPIEDELKRNHLDIDSQSQLNLALEVRSFASTELGLPNNKSYTMYSEINREYVGWNVYATPRFSVEPKTWCFPIAGCTVYRGYFSKGDALQFAEAMAKKDFDVFVGPFTAYSTLGWYDDPVLSCQLRMNPIRLAGLIIHELAHQEYYLPGDSHFSEAFAVTVERAGVLQWLKSKKREDLIIEALRMWDEEDAIVKRMVEARNQLRNLYRSGLDPNTLEQKKAVFQALKRDLHGISPAGIALPNRNGEECEYNNASLVPVDTYYSIVPVFQSILNDVGGNLPEFYKKVRELGTLSVDEREKEIESLQRRIEIKESTPKLGNKMSSTERCFPDKDNDRFSLERPHDFYPSPFGNAD